MVPRLFDGGDHNLTCLIPFISSMQESVLTNVSIVTQATVGVNELLAVRNLTITGAATVDRPLTKPNMLLAKLSKCVGVNAEISD